MSENEVKSESTTEAQSVESDVIKIKQEKIDPEIEEKINATLLNDTEDIKPIIGTNGINERTTPDTNDSEDSRQSSEDNAADDNCNGTEDVEPDEKKSIEPVKSSNEILLELFKVFNASPPEELLNDENLLKKSKHKKHKKEKKKKKKKSKVLEKIKSEKNEFGGSESSAASTSSKHDEVKNKHRKHKKHKHKEEKSSIKREKSKDKQKAGSFKEKTKNRKDVKVKETNKPPTISKEHNTVSKSELATKARRKHSADDKTRAGSSRKSDERKHENHREVAKEHNSFYNGFQDSERGRMHSPSRSRHFSEVRIKKEPIERTQKNGIESKARIPSFKYDGHVSEISLSDEETYLSERSKHQDTRSQRNAKNDSFLSSRHDDRYSKHNSFYTGAEREKRNRESDRGSYRYRHRTRSRSRSRDLGIDKKRLLEIARKNAISMFKRGNLPGCAEMTEEIKDKVLLKMRYGGRTVQDLTEFCKKLSNGENLNDISDLSSEEDSDVDKRGNAKAFNHPFVIKEREPIVMRIRGSAPIVPRKQQDEQTKAITLQFPVSSGQQHRMTEAWVPVVEPKTLLPPLPALSTIVSQSASVFKTSKNIFEKTIPVQAEQEPAFKATNAPSADGAESGGATLATSESSSYEPTPATALLTTTITTATPLPVPPPEPTASVPTTAPFVADVPVPSASDSIFPLPPAGLDVSSIISKRLNAMRRLQDNPLDAEAIKMMYCTQKDMSSWVSSKHMPGQFTGSTGANMLSARELNSGPQAWARRDQLTSTIPVTGGMGMALLKKMGWKPGEGLGREKTGSLQPLLLDVKLDKRGLVSEEDSGYQQRQPQAKKRRTAGNVMESQDLSDKHPVSLLNELTSKRKWTPPLYTLVDEGGPSHNKMFLFSVSINGQTFTPPQGSNTKKDAKVKAARHCLQQIGIIPQ